MVKASIQELLIDYEDYLRMRGLTQWTPSDQWYKQMRRVVACHNDVAYYREAVQVCSDEAIANIAITLILQTDAMLAKLMERLKIQQFMQHGGIREEMTHVRLAYRNRHQGQ